MVDRLNVGYAKLQFLADLHFDEATFGMAAGALYIGYILFEIPSNLMLERIGVRATLLRIMALWGVFAMAMAFAADRWSFYGLRFLIGVAEAGFFPGILFYLTLWFPNAWRARITSLFALAVPLSGVLAAPASSWIMTHMAGVSGLRGWQWLFLIEGAPAVGLAVAAYFYLPNRPSEARFLTAEEKAALARDLSEDERRAGAAKGGFLAALKNPRVYGLGLVYFAFYSTQSILLLWVPTLLKNTGLKDLTEIGWRASAVFVVGAIGMAARRLELRSHAKSGAGISPAAGVIATAALSSLPLAAHDANATMLLLMAASAAIFAYLALFWTVPTAVLGSDARAGGIAARFVDRRLGLGAEPDLYRLDASADRQPLSAPSSRLRSVPCEPCRAVALLAASRRRASRTSPSAGATGGVTPAVAAVADRGGRGQRPRLQGFVLMPRRVACEKRAAASPVRRRSRRRTPDDRRGIGRRAQPIALSAR